MKFVYVKKYLLPCLLAPTAVLLGLFLFSDHPYIWPVRNTVQYHLTVWLSGPITEPDPSETGSLSGRIQNRQGQAVDGAWVLVAHRSGATFSSRTAGDGAYTISNIPPGTYRPVAGAPGYESIQFGRFFGQVTIQAGQTTTTNAALPPHTPALVSPGQNLQLSDPVSLSCNEPLSGQAIRQEVTFTSAGQPNQPTFYYLPVSASAESRLPLLLAIYPGPADSWECASLPLAAAGYAVLAAGPAYTFDLESDLDELERLLTFARSGQLPGTDGRQIALLGGSYSSLHVQRLLQRGQDNIEAALLLGPPTDLFDMRRRLENGTFVPPFGLDQAMIAVGLPNRVPLRYWRYSGAYHVRSDFPPLAILHSYSDDVVPFQQSDLLARNLELVGAPYETYFFEGAGHYLLAEDADEDTLKVYNITLEFLARQVQQ